MRIKRAQQTTSKPQNESRNKLEACLLTDCGHPGKYYNCIECFYNLVSGICNPNNYKEYISKYNVFLVNATGRCLELVKELKSLGKRVIILLECSESFRYHRYINGYEDINCADLVLCQFGEPYRSIVQSYFDVPFVFFGVPADIDYISNFTSGIKKEPFRIHVCCLSGTEHTDFNTQTNFLLCKKIQEKIPEVKFVCPSIHPVYAKYLRNVEITGGVDQRVYWGILGKCSLAINMMDRITWGRYFIECCSIGVPSINTYSGACDLSGCKYFNEFDINSSLEEAMRLLTDESYNRKVSRDQLDKIQVIKPENMLCKLSGIIK